MPFNILGSLLVLPILPMLLLRALWRLLLLLFALDRLTPGGGGDVVEMTRGVPVWVLDEPAGGAGGFF